jgi:hypothetical protein
MLKLCKPKGLLLVNSQEPFGFAIDLLIMAVCENIPEHIEYVCA